MRRLRARFRDAQGNGGNSPESVSRSEQAIASPDWQQPQSGLRRIWFTKPYKKDPIP